MSRQINRTSDTGKIVSTQLYLYNFIYQYDIFQDFGNLLISLLM